jgi:hypothetical protein
VIDDAHRHGTYHSARVRGAMVRPAQG